MVSMRSYMLMTKPRDRAGVTSARYVGEATAERPRATPVSSRPAATITQCDEPAATRIGPATKARPATQKTVTCPRVCSTHVPMSALSAAPTLAWPTMSSVIVSSRARLVSLRSSGSTPAMTPRL